MDAVAFPSSHNVAHQESRKLESLHWRTVDQGSPYVLGAAGFPESENLPGFGFFM